MFGRAFAVCVLICCFWLAGGFCGGLGVSWHSEGCV